MARFNADIYTSGDKIGRVRDAKLTILNAAVRGDINIQTERLKEISYQAAVKARLRMRAQAPDSAGKPGGKTPGNKNKLKNAIDLVEDKAIYRPAGRGGFFETKVVIDEKKAPHARFVIRGTGLYNPNRRGYIFPKKAKVMRFPGGYRGEKSDLSDAGQRIYNFQSKYNDKSLEKKSGLTYTNNAIAYKTRGQRPNNDFIIAGRRRANNYIREALRYTDARPY